MQHDTIEEITSKAKQQGRRLLVAEFDKGVALSSTENPKMVADQIGEAIAAAVVMLHSISDKEGLNLTIEEVFEGVTYACFARANKLLSLKKAKSA